jgi:hypothetical protein
MSETRPSSRRRGVLSLGAIVLTLTGAAMLGILALLLRGNADPGIRVWMLNHAPDQAIIINPFSGRAEKKFLVADGLKELAFSRDYTKAYVANVVDVSNRLKVINTTTYLQEDEIEVDGVPQGIGTFPDNSKLAIILGSKTDFMAGGFDVIDLDQRSKADPSKRVKLYRERDLSLTHKIAVGDDGDRIYCIDAKKPLINIYSFKEKQPVGSIDLKGSPEELYYPRVGDYYYVSVLQHYAIYQIDKKTDQITAAYTPIVHNPDISFERGKVRFVCVDSKAEYLFASAMEAKTVFVWQLGNPEHLVDWNARAAQGDTRFERLESFHNTQTHYLPMTAVRLGGHYEAGNNYTAGPERLAVDELNQNLFVQDEDGALYIFDFDKVLRNKPNHILTPLRLVTDIEGEMRDLKVSRPVVRGRQATAEAAQ